MKKKISGYLLTVVCALLSSGAIAQPGDIRLDTPVGGWREGDRQNTDYTQQVSYPASSVNVKAKQSYSARIRGQIQNTPKGSLPATLVVNGVAMPLKVQDDGSFDRPYSFPAGSNGVEIRSPDGQSKRRVQFYDAGKGATPAKLRVLLNWDSDNTDLDLHVVTPDGDHAWYGQRVLQNGGALDVDVTTGYGPEIFSSAAPQSGLYLVYVNYYGGGYNRDDKAQQPLTVATVTVISQEGTPNEKQESFIVPMRQPGELTLIKTFSYQQ